MSKGTDPGSGRGAVSHWELERYLRGDLPPAEAERMRLRLAGDPDLAAWVEAMGKEVPARGFAELARKAAAQTGPAPLEARFKARWSALWERPGLRRPAFAFGLLLFAVAALSVSTRFIGPKAKGLYAAKGGGGFEILMATDGSELEPGSVHQVTGRDTLRFHYRSQSPRYVQIWFAEDSREPQPVEGAPEASGPWPATNRWRVSPKRFLSEGDWSRQTVFAIASECRLSLAQAKAAFTGTEAADCAAEVRSFDLVKKP